MKRYVTTSIMRVLFFSLWTMAGCAYPQAIVLESPLTNAINDSHSLRFEERSEVIDHRVLQFVLDKTVEIPDGCIRKSSVTDNVVSLLKEYIQQLSSTDFRHLSDNEQLALLINLHNAVALLHMSESLKAHPNVNDASLLKYIDIRNETETFTLGETSLTMPTLRNRIIRPLFRNPSVLFVLANGSRDFAPFTRFTFSGRALRLQLETVVRRMIYDKRYMQIDYVNKRVRANRLFHFASQDIVDTRSRLHAPSLKAWLIRYGDDDIREVLGGLGNVISAPIGKLPSLDQTMFCQESL